MESAEVGLRLLAGIKTAGISQAEFSRTVGCSTAAVSRAIKGHQWPTLEMLDALSRLHGISASWIISGVGPQMLREEGPDANLHHLLDRALAGGDASRIRGFLEAMAGATPLPRAKSA